MHCRTEFVTENNYYVIIEWFSFSQWLKSALAAMFQFYRIYSSLLISKKAYNLNRTVWHKTDKFISLGHYNAVLHQIQYYSTDRVKRIWYLSPMRAAKVQASLRIRAVSPEPPLLAHTSSESRETFRQKARSLAPLNGWACAVKMCHDGMLEDTNSLDGAQLQEQSK